jgi:hypothetical protein
VHGTVPISDEYALVSPQGFSDRMNDYWTKPRSEGGLGQFSSNALRTLWRIMGENYVASVVDAAKGVQSPWRILQPPTGTGKTQGTCVYASMQADHNRDTDGTLRPVGILIVTRLKEDANNIQSTINALADRRVAVVHHSDSKANAEELHQSDVVVITHQAFLNAKRGLREHNRTPWERLVSWRGGQRLLTIIDEALANVVDESNVTTENLAFVIERIPPLVRLSLPQEVAIVEQVHRVLLGYTDLDGPDRAMAMIWKEDAAPSCFDLGPLRAAMAELPYDRFVYGRTDAKDRARLAERVDDTLNAVQTCLDQFAYYSKAGELYSINSAALAIPLDTPGPVVLDATARANFVWDLFEERHVRPDIPNHARDYRNATLHLARATGLGKTSMSERCKERLPRLKKALAEALGPERSVFMCVHKDVEDTLPKSFGAAFKQFAVGHWGAVDGRNTWQDYDTAVILGLPFMPKPWATNIFFALQGAQDDKWLQSPEWKQFTNVRTVMEQRQLSVSVIQAINRICCRHVIDAEGNCPPADIFIVLPGDVVGDAILEDIRADMPGLKIEPWDFELDAPKAKSPRGGHARLIEYMASRPDGAVSLPDVQRDLGLPNLKKLREALNKEQHSTTQALAAIGVLYIRGKGRGSKSYLVKKTNPPHMT